MAPRLKPLLARDEMIAGREKRDRDGPNADRKSRRLSSTATSAVSDDEVGDSRFILTFTRTSASSPPYFNTYIYKVPLHHGSFFINVFQVTTASQLLSSPSTRL